MSLNSVVCNLISSIKVACKHNSGKGRCVYSNYAKNILEKLKMECIIDKYEDIFEGNKRSLTFNLLKKYDTYLLIDIKVVSTPGKRVYLSFNNLSKELRYYNGMLVSTNIGVLNYKECKINKVGGELILLYK